MTPRNPPRDLRDFLSILREEGELVEVDAEVSSDLEAAEIHRRVIAAGGPALLFNRVSASPFRLTTNLFGSARRVDLAFGGEASEYVARLARAPHELVPPKLGDLWKNRDLLKAVMNAGTKRIRSAPVTEVVNRTPDLTELPALRTWKRDGGAFITLPLVETRHPVTGISNLGMYRSQIYDANTCGLHIQIQRGGEGHLAVAEARGEALPVRLHVGGPPALILSAIAPLPEDVPELLLAGFLQGHKLETCANPLGGHDLLARAEFALVGEAPAGERREEGPFGDHYGYYSETHPFPLMRCKALCHRKDAIFPATVVGKPRQEDFFLGDYLQALLSPLFPVVMPGVLDLWSYGETGYHSLSAARVEERYKREAMKSAFRILGEGQLSLTKFLMLVDADVDLHDFRALLTHVLERADLRTDLFIFANLSMDTLDYAGPKLNEGSKGVLLGVGEPRRKLPGEFTGPAPGGAKDVRVFCPGCLVVEGPSHDEDPDFASALAADPALADWPLVVLSDDAARATRSATNFLWSTFTRFDPASDITAKEVELYSGHASYTPPVVIDARMKGYPEELFCDDETSALVDKRWSEYFPAGGVEMGDSSQGHLA
ncbi:MAG: UbiD family decarboxylase [Planctomycetes bacterium]|nr:UbiD family decarboxylase [Planctomycetota bacterium]